jgi:hypothetical protein
VGARRILLVAMVLCATVCAQSAALSEEQETHHGSDHCCGLCHLGPAPVLPAATSAVAAPVFARIWLAAYVLLRPPHEVLVASAGSRAPPA